MLYSVYKTVNKVNNKQIIGVRCLKNNETIIANKSEFGSIFDSGYLGSGKLIREAIEKYGPLNFSQELILLTDNRKTAEELEKELARAEWTSNIDYASFPVLNNLLKARLIAYENTEPK